MQLTGTLPHFASGGFNDTQHYYSRIIYADYASALCCNYCPVAVVIAYFRRRPPACEACGLHAID